MKLTVNGKEKKMPDELTVSGLLEHLGISVKEVAVEVNREIVPRSQHVGALLKEGDRVEIVTFVQGG